MKCKNININGRNLTVFDCGKIFEDSYTDARGHVRKSKELLGSNLCGYRMIRITKDNFVKSILFHRIIADCFCEKLDPTFEVDHINGDRADNRAENLRWVSHEYNIRAHRSQQDGVTSRFRGVYKSYRKWVSKIGSGKSAQSLGSFDTEEDAARSFNNASIALGWPKESLNKGL